MKLIFVDSSAWVALFYKRDARHDAAIKAHRAFLESRCRYITSNFVFDETVTFLRNTIGHAAAVDFGDRLRNTGLANLIQIDDVLEQRAWEIFKQYADKQFSFTDCTSFALMQKINLTEAFTHDHHFEQFGFNVLLKEQ
jgi:predicted nucleic acid-binding protein